jgi:hypothetical protein
MSSLLNLQETAEHEPGYEEEIAQRDSPRGDPVYHPLHIGQHPGGTPVCDSNQPQAQSDPSREPFPSHLVQPHVQLPNIQQSQQNYEVHHHHGNFRQQELLTQQKKHSVTGQSFHPQQENQEICDSSSTADDVDVAATSLTPATKKARRRYDNNFKVGAT